MRVDENAKVSRVDHKQPIWYAHQRIDVFGGGLMPKDVTFGRAISKARKANSWSLRDVCARVKKEDGEAISPQYLNDIEHDRRNPSSDRMVQQFAETLTINPDWLYYLAGKIPEDVREKNLSENEVISAMVAFRREVPKK